MGRGRTQIYKTLCSLFKLKPKTVEEEAFLLVKRAMSRALVDLLHAALDQDQRQALKKDATKRWDEVLKQERIELTSSFFVKPTRTGLVGRMTRHLASWLRIAGLTNKEAERQAMQLPDYFVAALAEELRNESGSYQKIVAEHNPEFAKLTENNWRWQQYYAKLQTQANPEVLDLGVNLDDVHIPLRAYTEPSTKGTRGVDVEDRNKKPRHVGYIDDLADMWFTDQHALFVVSGGPGSGKSMFAKRLAAWRAWTGPDPWRVLYVPLQRFDVVGELRPALEEFAARALELSEETKLDLFATDATQNERVLIVFDGLDELAMKGAVGEEIASKFYTMVDSFINTINTDPEKPRLKVLLAGRPVAISLTDADTRRAESVRYLLPYVVPKELARQSEWQGMSELAKEDQRDAWWQKYGRAIGNPDITKLPAAIRGPKLDPLTAEPILNSLVARCMAQNGRRITAETNRAQIYEWMLEDVLKRVHDPLGKPILPGKDTEDVARLLEEIAVSAWHRGDIRFTTKTRVKEHCERFSVKSILDKIFPDDGKTDITPIFLAFYFQEVNEQRGTERAFEFSHKSYGEYLVARRIVRFLGELHQHRGSRAWTDDMALEQWAKLFGPAGMTPELHAFVLDVIDSDPKKHPRNEWREDIVALFSLVVRQGLPMEKLQLPRFADMERQNRHATAAFLIVHSACYRTDDTVLPIKWPTGGPDQDVAKGDFYLRLIGHREYARVDLAMYMRGWDLSNVNLNTVNLAQANFAGANLEGANLEEANLEGANLEGANLVRVNLSRATFDDLLYYSEVTNLEGANLEEANLSHADLARVNFAGANLTRANLTRADLDHADIVAANLSQASISREQILQTTGAPAVMPDGNPPEDNWREKLAKLNEPPPR